MISHMLFLITISSLISVGSGSIANKDYRFKKIGIEQGLSQSSILAIEQDERGYIWIATASGLNRYDGYEFIVFVNQINDSLSISSNEITALCEDKEGYLWIGTSKGVLDKFDPQTGYFTHFDIASSSDWYSSTAEEFSNYPLSFSRNYKSSITTITEDNKGNLWIGTWGKGIVKFNPKSGNKKYYYHFENQKNSLSSNKIIELIIDRDNILWVGTFGGGLNRIMNDQEEVLIENYKINSEYLFGNRITSLYEDSDFDIWVGSYAGGLSKIKKEEKLLTPNEFSENNSTNAFGSLQIDKNINVMAITEDFKSNIWIGTYGDGLYKYSKNSGLMQQFLADPSDPNSLSDNELQSLFVDRSGIVWIGTQLGNGINKLEIGGRKFNSVPILTEDGKSLNDKIIWAIFEDSNHDIWIGTHKGGINWWDKETDEFTYFKKDINLADNHIRSIEEDKFGNLWFGTYSGGLSLYNRSNSSFINFSKNEFDLNSINGNQIQSLLIQNDTILWIGVFGGGLNKLNLNHYYESGAANFTQFIHHPVDKNSLSDNRVYDIFLDSRNSLWIGTLGGGLNKFDDETETFIQYKSVPSKRTTLSDNRILVIHESNEGNLLIGTFGGGLNIYNVQDDSFERLNERITINFSDVYGILPGERGYWLSTDKGIYNINLDLNLFRQFELSDGLQSMEFSGGAYLKSNDGICYFGGINGINYFDPDEIKLDEFIPPIVISSINVFDKPIRGIKENLVFDMDENYFSFEFASLDYRNSNKNKYKYILEGLDTKWSHANAEERRVFYTNLAPGEYTFKVRGTNNDGIWSPKEATVDITILAPFWLRWWFISGLILLLGAIITFFINQRIRYLVALDKLKTNIAADLHDNVGAGLTEISILSELATNDIERPVNAKRHIELISELSRRLVESMSDIVWVVNPTRDSLYDLIVRLKDAYGELLADLGIKLSTSNLEELYACRLPMDYRQNLYLILKESLNNCIKHSNCSKIEIMVEVLKNKLSIKLIDNGVGFDVNSVYDGNGLHNIKERGQKIGGNIKIISYLSEGTTIAFEGKVIK